MNDANKSVSKDNASNAEMKSSLIINKTIGDNLRNFRITQKLSQEALASQLGISVFRLRRYELGRHTIPYDVFYRVCGFFKVSIEDFSTLPAGTDE